MADGERIHNFQFQEPDKFHCCDKVMMIHGRLIPMGFPPKKYSLTEAFYSLRVPRATFTNSLRLNLHALQNVLHPLAKGDGTRSVIGVEGLPERVPGRKQILIG